MKVYNKIKWILGIFVVFFLIAATNMIDRDNFKRVRDSVVTIYEDRLVVQGLIFEFSELMHKKQLAVVLSDDAFFKEENGSVNNKIKTLTNNYLKTKLTLQEERVFKEFQVNLNTLDELESTIKEGQIKNASIYKNQINLLKENLRELSQIQISEGSRQSLISKEAVRTVELFTQIEIYFLVFLAILIQVLVIYKPKSDL
ncbi:MAG: hypothetical protein Sapg2KO_38370 [Saprospiraceae bacterium]